jgi:hypothetical protein
MRKSEVVILCLRLIGIFYFIAGLTFFPVLIEDLTTRRTSQWSFCIAPLFELLIGAVLYFKAQNFVNLLIDCSDENDIAKSINTSNKTARIALMVLGFYILANAIPHFFQILVNTIAYNLEISTIPEHLRQIQQHWRFIVEPTLKIIISLWLILGNKGFVKLLGKFDNTFNEMDKSNQ